MTQTQREVIDGKPLGDTGTGASGGGSIGNLPGGAQTGGDARQGVRPPDASQQPDAKTLEPTEVADTDRKNHVSASLTPDVPKGADPSTKQTATEAALPSTIDKNPLPKDI